MKYEDVRAYIDASLEYGIAVQARWQSLVPVSEVAKLGAIAFGPRDEKYRRAVDHIVRYAAAAALGLSLAPNPAEDLEADRALTPPTAVAMREYAKAVAEAIVKRQAKAGESRAVENRERRGTVTHYTGVWEDGETYSRGAMTTHDGTLWHCETDSTTDKPGTSKSWRLMVKTKGRV